MVLLALEVLVPPVALGGEAVVEVVAVPALVGENLDVVVGVAKIGGAS
jgi:hypothetical protein